MTSDLELLARARQARRCRRHEWVWGWQKAEPSYRWTEQQQWPDDIPTVGCRRCGKVKDETVSRRGKNNRSRGNAIEREVCKLLGIRRVGMYGGSEDGGAADDWITVQVKSGGAYPERIDRLLRALPMRADRLRAVVHADAPGAGHRRRILVTLDLDEFSQWVGNR